MEKICLEIKDLELSYLDQSILSIPHLAIHQLDRIGVIGKNGVGKSTLLKVINGDVQPPKGKVNRLIDFAYFDQLSAPNNKEIEYEYFGKLSIPEVNLEAMSGGERTRLKLAHIFSHYYEGLLIDEPTTHLDEGGVQFFIQELKYYYGALVIASHDRYALDSLVTKIWEIDEGKVTEYTGNYSDYLEHKELEKRQQLEEHEKYLKEKSRLLKAAQDKKKKAAKIDQANGNTSKKEANATANRMFMTKSKGTSQKGVQKAAKALEHRINQLEEVEAPDEESILRFHQSKALQLHNNFPIMGDQLTLNAGTKTLLKQTSFQFPLGKKIAISGTNGSGKSTLLTHIIQNGEGITLSPKAVIGFYNQMDYQFQEDQSVIKYLRANSDKHESRIRAAIHAMGFTENDLIKSVKQLSGGESLRLALCKLFLGKYNILILDEPTNFLDLNSIEALERFFLAYEGTIIFISHDRRFIEHVADLEYQIKNQKLMLIND